MQTRKHPDASASSSRVMSIAASMFLLLLATSLHVGVVECNDNLRVAYEWKEIDFKYANSDERWTAIENREFKPNNVIPFGLEVYRSRLFVTLPRWKDGVPASLAYLDLNGHFNIVSYDYGNYFRKKTNFLSSGQFDKLFHSSSSEDGTTRVRDKCLALNDMLVLTDNSTKSPALTPFPSWEAHSLTEEDPELISPFRIRADRCGRLWVLDSRISGVLEKTKIHGPAELLIYDLHNDNLLRRHRFPANQVKQNSLFANLAVEDGDCENTFAYAGDLGNPGLVVYSWQAQESWRVQHNFFHPDPLAGNFSIDGIDFQWDDGVYGLAISKAQSDGFATLYFHPLSSTMEFSVNTQILRNKTLATSGGAIYREFKILGSRGPNAQAGASFLDQLTGVLFYALPNLNAVACWKTSNRAYTIKSQGRVYMSPAEMVFPSDVKVDDQDRLWVLSNRLHEFIYEELYPGSINFRILTAHVKDAIENTACDIKTKPLPELINRLGDILNTVTSSTTKAPSSGSAATSKSWSLPIAGAIFCVMRLLKH